MLITDITGARFVGMMVFIEAPSLELFNLHNYKSYQGWMRLSLLKVYNNGAITNETTAISLTTIFNVGPEVSLNGSPTVSPQTAAL